MSSELRIPTSLLASSLERKEVKALRFFASAKLLGHRASINDLYADLQIHHRTGSRLIKQIVEAGWAGSDGQFLFPRSWRRLTQTKRRGLYITEAPKDLKKFEALCFAHALKKIISRKASLNRPEQGRTKLNSDLPTTYLCAALRLKERRFKTLKALAQRYKFLSVTPQYRIIGKDKEFASIRKHLSGVPVFKRGRHTVVPEISKIKVLI